MGHDHPLNYYAVYCPIAMISQALSHDKKKDPGFHAVGTHPVETPMTSLPIEKQASSSTQGSKDSVR